MGLVYFTPFFTVTTRCLQPREGVLKPRAVPTAEAGWKAAGETGEWTTHAGSRSDGGRAEGAATRFDDASRADGEAGSKEANHQKLNPGPTVRAVERERENVELSLRYGGRMTVAERHVWGQIKSVQINKKKEPAFSPSVTSLQTLHD